MSRFHDQTSLWFTQGEDEAQVAALPQVDRRVAARRPPYLLLGVAAASLASACGLYVALKMSSHAEAAGRPTAAVSIQIDRATASQPAESPADPMAAALSGLSPKATAPAQVEAAPAASAESSSPLDPASLDPAAPRDPLATRDQAPARIALNTPVSGSGLLALPPPDDAPMPRGRARSRKPAATPELRAAARLLANGRAADALAAYQSLIERDANNTAALRGACLSLDKLGRVNDAARVCRRALGFAAGDRDTRAALARIYFSGGAYQWSANEWRRILTASPRDPEARRGLRHAQARL